MSGKKNMKQYPKWMKEQAIKMFYEEGKTRREITEHFGIIDKDRVKKWLRQYRKEGFESFSKPKGRPINTSRTEQTPEERIKQLEMENELLRSFLHELERWDAKN